MAIEFALPVPRYANFGRLWRLALTGPEAGAVLLFSAMFASEANFRVGDMEQLAVDWQIILRLTMCGLCGLYGLAHLSHTRQMLTRFPAAWLALFVAWASVCAVFSPDKAYAAASCGSLGLMILFIPAVLLQLGGRNFVLVMLAEIFAYTIGSWFAYFYFPELGTTAFATQDEVIYRLGGLGHANDTGMQAAVGIVLLASLGSQRAIHRGFMLLLLPLFAVTLIYTDSRTALLTACGAVALCVWRTRPLWAVAGGFVLLTALVAGSLALSDRKDNPLTRFSRSGEAEEIYSMTGRVEVWSYVVDKIMQSPVVGYGHNCSRFAMAGYNFGLSEDLALYHAHNTLLNITLGIGLPGGALLVMMFLSQGVAFVLRPNAFPDIILALIVISGVTEVSIFHPIPDVCSALWLAALFWRQAGLSLRDDSGRIALETL
jgi:O-antigen ligase